MTEFTTLTTDLKKALSIVALATNDVQNTLRSHALFDIRNDTVFLSSTDEDKIATSCFSIDNLNEEEAQFTADPKRLLSLLSNSDSNKIKFKFQAETNSVMVNASDNEKSFISFPSFDPSKILTFDLSTQELVGAVNSDILLKGFKFIQGFLPRDDKNKVFSNLFIENGVMYGSDGSNNIIGAFKNEDLKNISNIVIRRPMLNSIINTIDKIKENSICIYMSDKHITFSCPKKLFSFGFRKSIIEKPRLPISTERPKSDGFNVDLPVMIKKLNRLSLSSYEDFAIQSTYKEDEILKLKTMTDRESYEELPCERISGEQPLNFYMECKRFKNILNLFQVPDIDFYIQKRSCTLYSEADIIIEENKKEITKPFIAVALMSLAREE